MADLDDAIRKAVREAVRIELSGIRTLMEEILDSVRRPQAVMPLLTPPQVAAQQRCRTKAVYDALQSGELPSERRPARGGKLGYVVRPEDAAAWGRLLVRRRKVVPDQSDTSARTLSADAA